MPEKRDSRSRRRMPVAVFTAVFVAGAVVASNIETISRAAAERMTPAPSPTAAVAGGTIINAITQPSERHKLSFPSPGVVKTEMTKEGDPVKAGQILVVQDDALESAEMEKAKVDAESTAKVDAAVADYNAKKHVYEVKLSTFKKGGANQQEVDDAELDMILRDKQINVARDEQQQAKIKYQQEQTKVQDMHLSSPVDGFVERMMVQSGEMADPQKPDGAVWVVKNNPLFIEIRDMPSREVAHLHLGDKLQVKYPDDSQWQPATVTFRSPVVDAASDTQLVKLTLDNSQSRDAGLQIQVQLPQALTEVGSGKRGDTAGDTAGDKSAAATP